MANGRIVDFSRRGVVAVSGPDARKFLNDLITSEIERAETAGASYGGLLTPQGKILFDFILFADQGRFLFDLSRYAVPDFVKRLGFYRLRAKAEIADISDEHSVLAAWGDNRPALDGLVAADPRLPALGYRAIAPRGPVNVPDHMAVAEAEYDSHRIRLGVPEGGIDFAFGDAFPHDADMDQLGGVDFDKGCYVGQEVVSRMEHRGTARRRFIIVRGTTALPAPGTEITGGSKPIGIMGSSAGETGLALVRLDRAREAIESGAAIEAGGRAVELILPHWARFGWPTAAAEV